MREGENRIVFYFLRGKPHTNAARAWGIARIETWFEADQSELSIMSNQLHLKGVLYKVYMTLFV
jgi:hypothetical protein